MLVGLRRQLLAPCNGVSKYSPFLRMLQLLLESLTKANPSRHQTHEHHRRWRTVSVQAVFGPERNLWNQLVVRCAGVRIEGFEMLSPVRMPWLENPMCGMKVYGRKSVSDGSKSESK